MSFFRHSTLVLKSRVCLNSFASNFCCRVEVWQPTQPVAITTPLSSCRYLYSKHSDSKKEITHDFEDEQPEITEVLQRLRTRHHYHGVLEAKGKKEHNVFVIEPEFKWGRHRFQKVSTGHRLEEACGLVEAITEWKVSGRVVEPVRKIDSRKFFGKGKIEELTDTIQNSSDLDAVYVDIPRLTPRQHEELEDLWGVKVFDRFGIVLQIFKERARTSEAKIQVELAEIPYLRYLK